MKKVLIISIGFLVVSSLCSASLLKNVFISNANASCIMDKWVEDSTIKSSSLIGLTKDQKIVIAKELFEKNLNDNKIDYTDESNPVQCFTMYNINNVELIASYVDKFIVRISYDVRYTNESDRFVAGNGKISSDNWIVNKSNFVEIKKEDNNFVIGNIF